MIRRGAALLLLAWPLAAQEDGSAFFEKHVRPLLASQCLGCHGATAMGGLRLDSREALLKGGARGPGAVPGKPSESLLLNAVRHTAGALKMPPGPKLKDADAALLARWIEMGAPWGSAATAAPARKYWAFEPPRKPAPPAVKNAAWPSSPIDAFLLAALEAKGLAPARPADKRTLIRRATYDLTGLPPTPAEVQAYLDDASPDAFARVVDRLLASPHYGERWGRHWLDVARYADSNGLDENLVYKNAFRYRDYVIAAFNRDKPYDQFVREQLAGDLLPAADQAATFERWTATGFLSLGAKMLAEDDPVKMEMDIVDEQIDTTARAFMGLTAGCARCHDHKFDPIPQADYYALAGIFKSSKTMENFKVVAKWHEYVLAPPEDRAKLSAHEASIEAKRKEIAKISEGENKKLTAAAVDRVGAYLLASAEAMRHEKTVLRPAAVRAAEIGAGAFARGNAARTLEKKKPNVPKDAKGPFFAEYAVRVDAGGDYQVELLNEEKGGGTAALWINGELEQRGAEPVQNREASPDAGGWSVRGVFALRAGENLIRLQHKTRFPYFAKLGVAAYSGPAPAPRTTVQVARARGVNVSVLEQWVEHLKRSNGAPASPLYAWESFGTGKPLSEWSSPAAKLFAEGVPATREELARKYETLFRAAVKDQTDPGLKALHELSVEKFGPLRAPADARDYYAAEVRAALDALDEDVKKLTEATPDYPRAMGVTESGQGTDVPLHIRGSHWTLGEKIPRGFLSAVSGGERPRFDERSSGRLQLAEWLTRPDHPLTARVMANRVWRWHFGRGIVPSVDNFGRLGEPPTNQPLLDWLAVQFVEDGWSIKSLHRRILLSSAYRMSSEYDARAAAADPENTLLWRMPRRRLEAEAIRDGIMAASGDLQPTTGGSILKYKDRQYVANTAKRGDIDYERNIRAVYIPVVRSSLYDVFRAFDLPDPATSNGDRDATVVAPQALFMMNGEVMLRHSRTMAESLLALPGDDAARIRTAYERALSRPPSGSEIDQALTFLGKMTHAHAAREGEKTALAWQSFCKALLASNEFVYLD